MGEGKDRNVVSHWIIPAAPSDGDVKEALVLALGGEESKREWR